MVWLWSATWVSGLTATFNRTLFITFVYYLRLRHLHLYVWPEQRLRTSPNRIRIPDVCVTLEDPGIDVFEAPPLVCVEILSPRDELSNVLEKLEEYAAPGVAHIWIVDPRRRKAFAYSSGRLEEVTGSELTTGAAVSIPLPDVFARL